MVFFERISSIEDMEDNFILQEEKEHFEDIILNPYLEGIQKEVIDGWIGSMHSELDRDKRNEVLDEFKNAGHGVLFACKMLDEGWDLPEIDTAILVSSSKSKTQRIQRIRRTLRKSEKRSLIITLYLPQTKEVDIVVNDDEIFDEVAEIHTCNRDTVFDLVKQLEEEEYAQEDLPKEEVHEISVDHRKFRIPMNHWAYQHSLKLDQEEYNFIILLELTNCQNSSVPDIITEPSLTRLRRLIDLRFDNPIRIKLNFPSSGLLDVGVFIIPTGDSLDFIRRIPKNFTKFIFWEEDELVLWEREPDESEYQWARHSWNDIDPL